MLFGVFLVCFWFNAGFNSLFEMRSHVELNASLKSLYERFNSLFEMQGLNFVVHTAVGTQQ